MSTIRVLVVDDSALIRQMLVRALSLDPKIDVVGTARNGVEALEKVRELHPDVITLDIEMPELTGLEALPHIIRGSEARVLMLSSIDDPDTTYQALERGAIDFISKPKGGFASSLSELADFLIQKIKVAYRVDPEKRGRMAAGESLKVPGGSARSSGGPEGPPAPARPASNGSCDRVVVMAASTGGPPALESVFEGLGTDLPTPFLVVQHLPSGFTASLAKRLAKISGMPFVEAEDGMRVSPGAGYLAPHGSHMTIDGRPGRSTMILLDDSPSLHGVRPAADPLFRSAARCFGARSTGVVLTGMGADGAAGLASIKDVGGQTVVQDEDTSVVWGMPGAAVRTGAAKVVAPLERIAMEIRRSVREGS